VENELKDISGIQTAIQQKEINDLSYIIFRQNSTRKRATINKYTTHINQRYMDRRESTYILKHTTARTYENKGDKLQLHNRGISLLFTGYKILVTVINNRLKIYRSHNW
jgi:hypothetical protein